MSVPLRDRVIADDGTVAAIERVMAIDPAFLARIDALYAKYGIVRDWRFRGEKADGGATTRHD